MCKKIGCFGSTIRVVLGVINVLFLLIGLAVFLSAAILKWNSNSIINKFNNDAVKAILNFSVLDSVSTALIIIGAIITLVSLVGLFGTIFINRFLLVIYEVIICSLFLSHVIILLIAVFKSGTIEAEFRKALNQTVERINDSGEKWSESCDSMKFLSQVFECCGANGLEDFKNKTMIELCCVPNCEIGCSDKVVSTLKTNGVNILVIPNTVILLFEFLILISVPCLVGRVGRWVRRRELEEDREFINPTTQSNRRYGAIKTNQKYHNLKEF